MFWLASSGILHGGCSTLTIYGLAQSVAGGTAAVISSLPHDTPAGDCQVDWPEDYTKASLGVQTLFKAGTGTLPRS